MRARRPTRRRSRTAPARRVLRRRNARPRTVPEAEDRERALAALAKVRREKWSLPKAAMHWDTSPAIVQRYVGSALQRTASGRYKATPFDRIPRTVRVLTPQGPVWVTVHDSRTASRIGEHRTKVKEWRRTREREVLKPFDRLSFRAGGVRYRFVTDPETLNQLDDADLLALETLYRGVQAGTSV